MCRALRDYIAEFVINKKPTTTAAPMTTKKPTTATKMPRRKTHIIVKPPMPTRDKKNPSSLPSPTTATSKMRQTPTSATITKAPTTVQKATTPGTTTPTGRPTGASIYRSTANDSSNSVSTIHPTTMPAVRHVCFLLLCSVVVLLFWFTTNHLRMLLMNI